MFCSCSSPHSDVSGHNIDLCRYKCNTGRNEQFALRNGTLCTHTTAQCVTVRQAKPPSGGSPSPPHPGPGGGGGPSVTDATFTWVGELAGGAHVALLVHN